MSLQSRHIEDYVSGATLGHFVERLLSESDNQEDVAVMAPQFQLRTYNSAGQIETRYYAKRFAAPKIQKRVLVKGSAKNLLQTLPLGFR